MFAIDVLTLDNYFHYISYKTNAYNSYNIQNNARDWKWKKNDLLSDSLN